MSTHKPITLNGESLTLGQLEAIATGAPVSIDPKIKKKLTFSAQYVAKVAASQKPVYGFNTGVGYLANKKIDDRELELIQYNLLRSHAAGWGEPLSISETRLAMSLRLNVLLKGYSGVDPALCDTLCAMINKGVYPIIPEYGSVGASGDLAPLAHLALALIGEGDVLYNEKKMKAKKALRLAGLKPYQLGKKEGLALINGTQIMLALGSLPLIQAKRLTIWADKIAALSYDALVANPDALDPLIHHSRGHAGQIASAKTIRAELQGSYLFDSATQHPRLQDSYSLRCAPQIHGPTRDALEFVENIISRELNAATDNPLIFAEEKVVLSGGNFHGQYVAMAFDMASIALVELGSVSERRLELLLNPHLSGLPAFLAVDNGKQSGYMALQYLSASLVNENKHLANPACTDSIPGNVGIEDHVSMGMTSARKFRKIVSLLPTILAAEAVAAAQAIDLRGIKKLGKGTKATYKELRTYVPPLTEDRIVSYDIENALALFKERKTR